MQETTLRNMKQSAKPKQPSATVVEKLVITRTVLQKAGNFPKKPQHTKKMHITGIADQDFYDEEGNRVTVSSQHVLLIPKL